MNLLSTSPLAQETLALPRSHGVARKVSDVVALTFRNFVHISREPFQLSDVTVQPVLFTLLFVYVFGAGMVLPGNASYRDFAIPGMLVFNQVSATLGTAVGLSTDINSGIVDRFRTLPMWNAAVLVARSVTDLATALVGATIVTLTGISIGWSTSSSIGRTLAGFGVVMLFAYAVSWGCACLGLASKGVETAQALGMLVIFPIMFLSNALVPTENMTPWLRAVTTWNPISAVTSAVRELFGNPNPSIAIDAWPMQHPVAASIIWSIAMLGIFVPLAIALYRRRAA